MLIETFPPSPASVRDPDRLAVLDAYNVLDSVPEEGFDDLAQLAALACATPVALVSLVADDRQWFKARVNFPSCETDLNSSVCKFALDEPDLLVIPDLTADPRTAANPLVTGEPHIRFYAGAPLRTPEGHVLGSLCVIDQAPRPKGLNRVQAEHLRRCARQVMSLLDLRRGVLERDAVLARQDAELRHEHHLAILAEASAALLTATDPGSVIEPILATRASGLGFEQCYIYDIAPDGQHLRLTQSINASEDLRRALAHVHVDAPLCGIVARTRRAFVLANVLASTEARYALARQTGIDAFAGYPILSHGELVGVISFTSAARPSFDEGSLAFFATIARYFSAVRERLDAQAALQASEAHWRSLFERLSEGFILGEVIRDEAGAIRDWRYLDVNAAWGALVSIEPATVIGRTIREVFPGIEDAWVNEFAEVVDSGKPVTFTRQVGTLARWYEGRAFRLSPERFGVIFLEITERVQAEARRAALLALGDRLRDLTSVAEMTLATCEILGTTLDAMLVGYGDVDERKETITVDRDWTTGGAASLAGTVQFRDYGTYIENLKRGETVIVRDCRTDPRTLEHAAALEERSARAFVNTPVFERGVFVALLYVSTAHPREWEQPELAFIRDVAARLRLAVARLRAEDHQDLLNHELSHRLKNTLAMVLSIAHQTLRSVPEREPVEAFDQRIQALATAHDLLLRKEWTGADLRLLCEEVLRSVAGGARITCTGPDVAFGPSAALSTSLLLHEMATNARKYGGLSKPTGGVEVRWWIEDGAGAPELVLRWSETGGPPVTAPSRRGFGSRLIRTGLVGTGGVEVDYRTEGVVAVMRAPLNEVRRS